MQELKIQNHKTRQIACVVVLFFVMFLFFTASNLVIRRKFSVCANAKDTTAYKLSVVFPKKLLLL